MGNSLEVDKFELGKLLRIVNGISSKVLGSSSRRSGSGVRTIALLVLGARHDRDDGYSMDEQIERRIGWIFDRRRPAAEP